MAGSIMYALALFIGSASAVFAAFAYVRWSAYKSGYADAVAEVSERDRKRLERQNQVAERPVSDDELRRSLEDGTF